MSSSTRSNGARELTGLMGVSRLSGSVPSVRKDQHVQKGMNIWRDHKGLTVDSQGYSQLLWTSRLLSRAPLCGKHAVIFLLSR